MKGTIALAVFSAALLFFQPPALPAGQNKSPLGEHAHCVAYKTYKKMFFMVSSQIVGKNCSIRANFRKIPSGLYSLVLFIPVNEFNSENRKRDEHVREILKADEHPEISFQSEPLPKSEWLNFSQRKSALIKGNFRVAGRVFPLKVRVTNTRKSNGSIRFSGKIKTKFTAFQITPPRIGPGGLITRARDILELHFVLQSQNINGLRSVLNASRKKEVH